MLEVLAEDPVLNLQDQRLLPCSLLFLFQDLTLSSLCLQITSYRCLEFEFCLSPIDSCFNRIYYACFKVEPGKAVCSASGS